MEMPRQTSLLTDPADLLDSSLRTAFLDLVKARRAARRGGAENPDFAFVADATLYAIHAGWLHGPRATRQLRALAAGVARLTAASPGSLGDVPARVKLRREVGVLAAQPDLPTQTTAVSAVGEGLVPGVQTPDHVTGVTSRVEGHCETGTCHAPESSA